MTTALPANVGAVAGQPGQSLTEVPNSVLVVKSGTTTFDVTSSCEFGVARASGVEAVIVISDASGTPSFTASIDGFDPATGLWEVLIVTATISGTGTYVLSVNPHIVAHAGSTPYVAARLVRRRMRLTLTVASGAAVGSISLHAN